MMRMIIATAITATIALAGMTGVSRAESLATLCAYDGTVDFIRPVPSRLDKALPDTMDPEMSVYRCVDSQTYVCDTTTNSLPSCERPDAQARRRYNPAAVRYCRENPREEIIPGAAQGHMSIYWWKCDRGRVAVDWVLQLDERGFIAENWKRMR
jgi:hypothetical protein